MHRPWTFAARGAVALGVGILILLRPFESLAALGLVMALWALLGGLVMLVHAIAPTGMPGRQWALLMPAVAAILLGVVMLFRYPELTLNLLLAWTSIWFLALGANDVYIATVQRRMGLTWGWTLVAGIGACLLGAVALVIPVVSLATIVGVIAAFAVASGLCLLYVAVVLARTQHALRVL